MKKIIIALITFGTFTISQAQSDSTKVKFNLETGLVYRAENCGLGFGLNANYKNYLARLRNDILLNGTSFSDFTSHFYIDLGYRLHRNFFYVGYELNNPYPYPNTENPSDNRFQIMTFTYARALNKNLFIELRTYLQVDQPIITRNGQVSGAKAAYGFNPVSLGVNYRF